MKIGVICYPSYGGSGVLATELGINMADKNHETHFISYQQPVRLTSFHPNVFYHEIPVMNYPLFEYSPYESMFTSKLVDIIFNEKIDVLHVHYAIPYASIAIMAQNILKTRGIYIPIVLTLHGTDITLVGKDKSFASVVEYSINLSDRVTTVSQNLKEQTLKHFKITQQIDVVHNFVNVKRFNIKPNLVIRKWLAPNDEKILVHISNFRKVKRVQDVIGIFIEVGKQLPCKLVLVGDGPERQNIENFCRETKQCNNIITLGKHDRVEDILVNSDIFLLPSEYESFGLASLEAMASSVPVVSTNTGGISEVVEHSKSGFLAQVGDVKTMSEYCLNLLKDPVLMKNCKQNAFERSKYFAVDKIVNQYENLYTEVINNKNISNNKG